MCVHRTCARAALRPALCAVSLTLCGCAQGRVVDVVSAVAIALLLPAAGYFGAKNRNSELVCCYTGCNFCGGCCSATGAVGLLAAISFFGAVLTYAAPAHECCPTLKACGYADDCTCTNSHVLFMSPGSDECQAAFPPVKLNGTNMECALW